MELLPTFFRVHECRLSDEKRRKDSRCGLTSNPLLPPSERVWYDHKDPTRAYTHSRASAPSSLQEEDLSPRFRNCWNRPRFTVSSLLAFSAFLSSSHVHSSTVQRLWSIPCCWLSKMPSFSPTLWKKWASSTIHQTWTRLLIPPTVQGYTTCSIWTGLWSNFHRQWGFA